MGPTSNLNKQNNQRRIVTRKMTSIAANKIGGMANDNSKRKADNSPPKDKNSKRSAFGDITNALGKNAKSLEEKCVSKKVIPKPEPKIKPRVSIRAKNPTVPIQRAQATIKKLPTLVKPEVITIKKDEPEVKKQLPEEIKVIDEETVVSETRKSRESSSANSDGSLYVSALEDIPSESPNPEEEKAVLPAGVADFDRETWNDPIQVSIYAMDIFNYLKEREACFKVKDYLDMQPSLSQWMRSLLVDWMVEVQESFELNHETLYLGVKLMDLYLSKVRVNKENLQLIGAAAIYVACKFDEHLSPIVDDFLYICDGAYTQKELLRMEANLLRVVDFNLGIPLSYRFLRRYARCAKLSLQMLTFARYILELSLMEYSFIQASDSKLAAAALLLALKTKLNTGWSDTLQYYSGYSLDDIKDLAQQLNTMLHKKPSNALVTIRNKYSHKIFFEVAKTPLLDKLDLE